MEAKAVAAAPTDSWRTVIGALFLAWAVGSAFLLLRLLHGCRILASLRRTARPLDARRYAGVLDAVASLLRIKTLPPIRTSPLVHGPAAGGLLRPCVLLPERLPDSLDDRQLRDVLTHECARSAAARPARRPAATPGRSDLLAASAGALSQPPTGAAREEVCDDHVLQGGDSRAYARTLLTLAEGGVCRPVAAAGLFDPNWKLEDRVAGLLDPRRTSMTRVPPWTFAGLAAALLAVCTAGAVVCAGGQPAKDEKPAPRERERPTPPDPSKARIEGVVVDEAGKPVAGALVRLLNYHLPPEMALAHTGADGSFRLVVDRALRSVCGRHGVGRGRRAPRDL